MYTSICQVSFGYIMYSLDTFEWRGIYEIKSIRNSRGQGENKVLAIYTNGIELSKFQQYDKQ